MAAQRDGMRIAHVTDCYLPRLGGIERQVHDLALLQHQRGDEVEVITSTTTTEAPAGPIPVRRPPPRRRGQEGDMRYWRSLQGRRAVLAGDYDLVHIHASAFSPLAFLTASSTAAAGIPTAVTVHSLWAYASPLFRAADVLTGWGRWRLAWSAVSAIAAQPLQQIVGPSTKVDILPNGVDTGAWHTEPGPRDAGRVVIATVGRLAVRKRPQPLLRMLEQARSRLAPGVELEVVIVGDGPLRPALERYVTERGMTGWVQLPGAAAHAEIRAVLARADLYVAPATLESFGIAALEARCAGLPVIAYADSGIADFIDHDVEGLLARDDREMVDHIVRLASDPALRHAIRAHNSSAAPAISWPAVLGRCEDLYGRARAIAGVALSPAGATTPES